MSTANVMVGTVTIAAKSVLSPHSGGEIHIVNIVMPEKYAYCVTKERRSKLFSIKYSYINVVANIEFLVSLVITLFIIMSRC